MDKVYELMGRARELPYGATRTALTEEALLHADAAGEQEAAYQVRMELTRAYQHGGEPAKAFTTFSRCLADHDRDPGRPGQDTSLLWHFKWIVNSLTLFPEVPLDRTQAVLDDMERRYRLGGHSMHAVYCYRHRVALHVGDAKAAEEWYVRWNSAPRDRLSDCAACDPSGRVAYLTWRERYDEALAIALPVLREEVDCTEQPQNILTTLLPVYLSTGRWDEARDAHRRAYRVLRTNLADLGDIAVQLEFCAATGNQARGLEIVERHLGWLDHPPTPYAAMRFATAAAVVARRLEETGHGELTVRRPAHGDRPESRPPVVELRAELTATALRLAERFDARNGSSHQGDLTQARLAAEPVIDHLPLTAHARAAARHVTSGWEPPEPVSVAGSKTVSEPGPEELLDEAEEHWIRRRNTAAEAALRRFDSLGRQAVAEPGPAGRRADGHGFERMADGDLDGALDAWRRAADLHGAAGDEPRRQAALSRVGAILCGAPDTFDEGFALIEDAVRYLELHARSSRYAVSARLRLAMALSGAGRMDRALAVLDGTAAGEHPLDRPDIELARAQVLIAAGPPDQPSRRARTLTALRRACAGYRAEGVPVMLAEAALLLAGLLADTGAHTDEGAHAGGDGDGDATGDATGDTATDVEVRSLLDEAVAGASAGAPHLRSAAHATRGGWLLARDRPAEAIEDFVEAVAGFTAAGGHEHAAHARVELAVAYYLAERYLDAAEVAEEAIPMLRELGERSAERRARYLLGNALREFGEPEAAAETFTELAREEDDPGAAAELLEGAGDLLSGLDKDGVAAERFAEAAAGHAAAGNALGAVRAQRRRGMCLMWSGRAEDGLAAVGQARVGLMEIAGSEQPPDEAVLIWEQAVLSYDEARVLAAVGRTAEALRALDLAAEAFTAVGRPEAAAAAVELRDQIRDEHHG